jgi:predicted ATP-dependent Lon-type protease
MPDGGMEFFDVHFSYIDIETMEEKFISVPEQGGGSLIPDGPLNPGVMHTVATGGSGAHLGLYPHEADGRAHSRDRSSPCPCSVLHERQPGCGNPFRRRQTSFVSSSQNRSP